jgi:hypothetical protein
LIVLPPVGGIMSVIHTVVLRVLPYRGPITAIALGASLATALVFIMHAPEWRAAVIGAGAIYGAIIGIMDTASSPEKSDKRA